MFLTAQCHYELKNDVDLDNDYGSWSEVRPQLLYPTHVFQILNTIACTYYMRKELNELINQKLAYFSSPWNYTDMGYAAGSLIASAAFYCIELASNETVRKTLWDTFHIVGAAATFLCWCGMLCYVRYLSNLDHLVGMVLKAITDALAFIVVFSTVMFAFWCAFVILIYDEHCYYEDFDVNAEQWEEGCAEIRFLNPISMITVLLVSMGSPNLYQFNHPFAIILVFLCMVILTIVLLNLLIAIVSDTHDHVQLEAELTGLLEKTEIIYHIENYELSQEDRDNKEYFPQHLYVMKARERRKAEDLWKGKVAQIEKIVKSEMASIRNELKTNREMLNAAIGVLQKVADKEVAVAEEVEE